MESLDQAGSAEQLARQAFHSRSQFFRLFRALLDETPAALRRRLLLERAAWHLAHSRQAVTFIALDAGYGSLEAFTRAFKTAFYVSPSVYRRMGTTYTRLPASNQIHFCQPSKGASSTMDLYDIFAGAETWHTRRLLDYASGLSNEQLDKPLRSQTKVFPWDTPDQSLRDILERMVYTKEVWTAALTGGIAVPLYESLTPEQRAPKALCSRSEKVEVDFERIMKDVHQRGAWDDTFVDALCEPPETFTFGGTFAHIVTFNAHRRLAALDALRELGVKVEGFGCPEEYLTAQNGKSA